MGVFPARGNRGVAPARVRLAPAGRAGWRPRWLPVGERDRFKSQAERFYRFYTWPNIVIYMPVEPAETDHGDSLFRRVQDVISAGGYGTWELG